VAGRVTTAAGAGATGFDALIVRCVAAFGATREGAIPGAAGELTAPEVTGSTDPAGATTGRASTRSKSMTAATTRTSHKGATTSLLLVIITPI